MSDVLVPLALLLVVLLVLGTIGGIGWWVVRRRSSAGAPRTAPAARRRSEAAPQPPVERSGIEQRSPGQALPIQRLAAESRERYVTAWRGVQSRFPERPVLALSEADTILTSLLGELGFPLDDPRPAAELLTEQHARVLDGFRAGHAIEQANTSSRSNEEQVRQGMQHFDRVFSALLEGGSAPYRGGAAHAARSRR